MSPGGTHNPRVQRRLDQMPQLIAQLTSDDVTQQYEATMAFRKVLSIETSPPIDAVIATGVIPRFVQLLACVDHPELQFEAAWVLTNIASGTSDNTKVVMQTPGCVESLVELLRTSPVDDVREQAVWALGNIAGDSTSCRDFVLSHGALQPVLDQFNHPQIKLSMQRNATWSLSNFCRGKPAPTFEMVRPALPVLARLIYLEDVEMLTDALWALSYLSDGTNDKIGAVLDTGVAMRLVELLRHSSHAVQTPALRNVGNIATGNDVQTDIIINCQALGALLHMLDSTRKSIRKEACWTISNITAGTPQQIQAVIDADIIPPLIRLLSYEEFDVKKEIAWAISNATSGGSREQIKFLVAKNCIKPLCDLLDCPDPKVIVVALDALSNILRVGQAEAEETGEENLHTQYIEEADGLDKLEFLQEHTNSQVYDKVIVLLMKYFPYEEEDQNLAPSVNATSGGYDFGAAAPQGGFNFG